MYIYHDVKIVHIFLFYFRDTTVYSVVSFSKCYIIYDDYQSSRALLFSNEDKQGARHVIQNFWREKEIN